VDDKADRYCAAFHETIELLGRRWNGVILQALLSGAERFGEVRQGVPGISDRLLTQRLRELECAGLVTRIRPGESLAVPRYVLTEKGRALGPVLDAVSRWAADWLRIADDGRLLER